MHPKHKARKIRGICNGKLTAWSIYPDQLDAMARRMQRTLTECRAVYFTGKAGDTAIVRELLKSIGLPRP